MGFKEKKFGYVERAIPVQGELVLPSQFLSNSSLSINSISSSAQLSIPLASVRDQSKLKNIIERFYPPKLIFDDILPFKLNIIKSNSLVNYITCTHYLFKYPSYLNNPEIEYRISINNDKSVINSASFLFNPLLAQRRKPSTGKQIKLKSNFKCIDYTFTPYSLGGLYLLPARPGVKNENAKHIDIAFFSEIDGISEPMRFPLPSGSDGFFIDYSFIPSNCMHYIVTSQFPWVTYAINMTDESMSMEHTLAPHYFVR